MRRLPRFFSHDEGSKSMDSKQKQSPRKLERRNAVKNVNYQPTASSSSEESSSHRKIDRCSPLSDRTSFRLEGIDGEIDAICQNLGLSPDDFEIPVAAWEARKARSDLLLRSRGRALNIPDVDKPTSKVEDESKEFYDSEFSGRLDGSVRHGDLYKTQSGPAELVRLPKIIQSPADGGRVGGINGVRPPLLAPPPAISLPAFDSACSTWDILRAFAPEGDRDSSFVLDRGFISDDADADEERVKGDKAIEVRFGETVALSETCSFTTTSNDDDSSSTTTEPTSNTSPNFRFRRTITSWQKGELLGRGSFGSVFEGITE